MIIFFFREDLDVEEYNDTKAETIEQIREFQSSLVKLAAGDLSLTDYFAAIQLVKLKFSWFKIVSLLINWQY